MILQNQYQTSCNRQLCHYMQQYLIKFLKILKSYNHIYTITTRFELFQKFYIDLL